MLAVDGQQLRAALLHGRKEQVAADHQRFLVGQQQPLARARGRQARGQARSADDSRHHGVDRLMGRHFFQRKLARQHLGRAGRLPGPSAPARGPAPSPAMTANCGRNCAHCCSIRSTCVAALKREHLEAIRMPRDHVQRVGAHRAGGAQDRDALFHHGDQRGQHHGQRQGGQQRVDPIEHAAMARQQVAGILDAGAALDQRLDQVAQDAHAARNTAAITSNHQPLLGQPRVKAGNAGLPAPGRPRSRRRPAPARRPCRPKRLPSSCRG